MKKIGLLSLALVLALGTLGIGYAWWDETLVVDATVGTGELEVIIRDGVYLHLDLPEHVTGTKEVDEDGKTATFTIDGLYPQEAGTNYKMPHVVRLSVRMDNVGTVPVKLKSATVSTCGSDAWDCMRAHLDVGGNFVGSSTRWGPGDALGLPGAPTRYHGIPFEELGDYIETACDGQVLEPGQFVRFHHPKDETDNDDSIYFWLDTLYMETGGKTNEFQDESLSFTITFEWEQFNA